MLVSVITPLYNAESWLATTVLSLQAQTYKNWEMLIVDDCSTDNSYQIAKELAAQDSRIKVFQLDNNGGAASARNKAIELAKGRFIAFLDSDDVWLPNKLEKQLDFMLSNNLAFTYTAYEKIDENGKVFGFMGVPPKVSYRDLLKTCSIGCLTAVYDTRELGKVYMPTNTLREDFALWLKILKTIDFAYGIQTSLAQYRVYQSQNSAKKVQMSKENWNLYRNVEKLDFIQALYYFLHYAIKGALRTKFPRIARMIGVLK